jgi:alpha-mannosidase
LGTSVALALDEAGRRVSGHPSVSVVNVGPLCTQLRVTRTLLGVPWQTVVTVWNDEPRVDLDVHVQWPGLEKWQVRMPLAAGIPPESIRYGTPFHGSKWDEVPEQANSGYSPDEVHPRDWAQYREVQQWLHLSATEGGLTLTTRHPAFYHDGRSLQALLFRTPPSGGDYRFHFTNAGSNNWHFEYSLSDADWHAAPERGDISWRRPIVQAGAGLDTHRIADLDGDLLQLSALMPGQNGSTAILRLVNLSDETRTGTLTGEIIGTSAELVDLDDNVTAHISTEAGRLPVTLRPWQIQTMRLLP